MTATLACRLCGHAAALCFEKTVLRRHSVGYYHCAACGLTQTTEPDWLSEAYTEAIDVRDTGLLARNQHMRDVVATFLAASGVKAEPCLDYAGGWGVFTRLMRDAGFAFHWLDPHAENLLARGFEWRAELGRPAACTAFEVLEHFVRPLEEFRRIAAFGADWLITSTEVPPASPPAQDWWYLAPETGQHVAFYERRTLERLGRECGYPHVIAGPFHQVFARRPFPAWRWRAAERLGAVLWPLLRRRRRSLTVPDSEGLRGPGAP
jgi:hypothetical protein